MKISKSKLLKKVAYILLCVLLCSVLVLGTYAKYALDLSTDGKFTANVYSKYSILFRNKINGADKFFYGAGDGSHGDMTFNIKNADGNGELHSYGVSGIILPYIWDVRDSLSPAQKLSGGELLGWSEFEPGEQKQSNIIGEQYHILEGGGANGQGTKDRTLYTVWQKEFDFGSKLTYSNIHWPPEQKIPNSEINNNYVLGVTPGRGTYVANYTYNTTNAATYDVSGYNYLEFDLYIPESQAANLNLLKQKFPWAFFVYLGSGPNDSNANTVRWNLTSSFTNFKTGINHFVLPIDEVDHVGVNEGHADIDFTKLKRISFSFDDKWGRFDENGKEDPTDYSSTSQLDNNAYVTGCTISNIKFTVVANDAPKALEEADYTTGIDAVMAKQAIHYIEYGEQAVHSAKIPTGGTYYRGVTNNTPGNYSGATQTFSSGQNIGPGAITPQYGDVYVYGDYEYRYNRTATSDHYWNSSNNNLGGWGVIVLNRSKVSYGQVLWEIADKPVISLNFAFGDADNLGRAPEVPPSVTSMYRAFNHCDEMLTAPKIPEGVTSTHGCFSDCYALREPSNIPSTVSGTDGMSYMFYDCVSMLYAPKSFPTNPSVTSMDRMFWDCQSIKSYPTIPNHITNLHSTFANNLSLVTAPNIPTSAVNMHSTFNRCEKITSVGAIPQGVVDLGSTFYRCMSLRDTITVNAKKLDSYANTFDYAGATFEYDKWTGVIDESTIVETYAIKVVVTSTEINHVKTYWQNSTKHCNITVQ